MFKIKNVDSFGVWFNLVGIDMYADFYCDSASIILGALENLIEHKSSIESIDIENTTNFYNIIMTFAGYTDDTYSDQIIDVIVSKNLEDRKIVRVYSLNSLYKQVNDEFLAHWKVYSEETCNISGYGLSEEVWRIFMDSEDLNKHHGMWFDSSGNKLESLSHDSLSDIGMPKLMAFKRMGKKWFSGLDNIDDISKYFTIEQLKAFDAAGFVIGKFKVKYTDYVSGHTIFSLDDIIEYETFNIFEKIKS